MVPVSPRLSLARPRLITQDSVLAQHPDDDGTFRQRLDLVGSATWSAVLYSTTGGQTCPSRLEPPIAHALSQSIAISGAAAGGVQHLALDFMCTLRC